MLSEKFQRKIYETYKADHDNTVFHGRYEYSIAHNACASIHTWIIRRDRGGFYVNCKWHWLQPLDKKIK